MPRKKPRAFNRKKEVRAIARERVGTVPPSKVIVPKPLRKKPKHKLKPAEDDEPSAGRGA